MGTDRRALKVVAGALVCLALSACAEPEPPEPVASVTLQESNLELPYPEWRSLRVDWQALRPLPNTDNLAVFVHLLDRDGELLRTFDRPLANAWTTNQATTEEILLYQSALGPPLPPGEYTLTLGLYGADGDRWPLAVAGEDLGRFEYSVATVTVPPVSSEAPAFMFQGPWSDAVEGLDAQILARRGLKAEASVRVQNLELPGSVWLRVQVPRPGGSRRLLPPDDSAPPAFDVTVGCSGVVRSFSPPDVHDFVLPVFPTDDESECAIRLAPNFVVEHDQPEPVDVANLEIVAWSPAEL